MSNLNSCQVWSVLGFLWLPIGPWCPTNVVRTYPSTRYKVKPLPQMIHQTLSFQVIPDNGNRIERMSVKPPPYVLYTGFHEPNQFPDRENINQELIMYHQAVNPCSYYRCNIWKLHFICKNINEMIQIRYKQNKFKFNFMPVRRNRKIIQCLWSTLLNAYIRRLSVFEGVIRQGTITVMLTDSQVDDDEDQ